VWVGPGFLRTIRNQNRPVWDGAGLLVQFGPSYGVNQSRLAGFSLVGPTSFDNIG
jgi:hypothetical protein